MCLTPVKQCFPSRKSMTGESEFIFADSMDSVDVFDDITESLFGMAFSDNAAATTLFKFGNNSLLITSDFKVPS